MRPLCEWHRRTLARHADEPGSLASGSPAARHLEGCPDCRTFWGDLRRLAAALPAAVAVPPAAAELATRIEAQLDAMAPARRPRFSVAPVLVPLAAAAIAVGVVTYHHPIPPLPLPVRTAVGNAPGRPPQAGSPRPYPTPGTPDQAPNISRTRTTTRTRTIRAAVPDGPTPNPGAAGSVHQPSTINHPPDTRPDTGFLDGRDPRLVARFSRLDDEEERRLRGIYAGLPPPADDFVRLPLPKVAAEGPAAVRAAVGQYKREAKVVDARLSRKVTIEVKGMALSDLCGLLRTQTGVDLTASRSVADEKVTLFVNERPAREVMRAVARLFNFLWGRSGEEGAYRYELVQDLKSQLAEEELRNADFRAALVALDGEMDRYRPYLSLTRAQLEERWSQRRGREEPLWNVLYGGGWGGMQLYHRLTPAERAALISGQELELGSDAADPDRHLPPEWQRPLLESTSYNADVGGQSVPMKDVPGIQVPRVLLRIRRSELGELSLGFRMTMKWPVGRGETRTYEDRVLATSRSPSAAKPENAALNASRTGKPPFDQVVTLRPEPSVPRMKRIFHAASAMRDLHDDTERPYVTSADVWEAVYRTTGQPVAADFYSHLYPLRKLTVERAPLFDALCMSADTMSARWTQDGGFLLCRSTSYYWDKLKEVPNRTLERWRKSKGANGGLPLSDFLEMAQLPTAQLDSAPVAEVIQNLWGLREWGILGGIPADEALFRPAARLLSVLTPPQIQQSLTPQGVPFRTLSPRQQRSVVELLEEFYRAAERQGAGPFSRPLSDFENAEIVAEYSPAAVYFWTLPSGAKLTPQIGRPGPIYGKTAEEVFERARRAYPPATPGEVQFAPDGHFHAGVRFVFYAKPPAQR